jgi:uncharacterized protein (DUF2249 family)
LRFGAPGASPPPADGGLRGGSTAAPGILQLVQGRSPRRAVVFGRLPFSCSVAMDALTPAIDVRRVPPPQRHPLIFSTFDALPPGGAFEIINDHDPVPLYFEFERVRSGQFAWQYLASGPALWQVRIARTRTGTNASTPRGCGGSGGCGCSGG